MIYCVNLITKINSIKLKKKIFISNIIPKYSYNHIIVSYIHTYYNLWFNINLFRYDYLCVFIYLFNYTIHTDAILRFQVDFIL